MPSPAPSFVPDTANDVIIEAIGLGLGTAEPFFQPRHQLEAEPRIGVGHPHLPAKGEARTARRIDRGEAAPREGGCGQKAQEMAAVK